MILSQTAEYAIRAMTSLALAPPGAFVPSKELAAETNIPLPYLSKVMRKLVEAKLADGLKGHHGGFRLAQAPDRISFAQILEAVDAGLDKTHCAYGFAKCNARKPCRLHHTFASLVEMVEHWSQKTSLADVRDGKVIPLPQLSA